MLPTSLQLLTLPLVYVWGVFLEWFIHRYVFHGLGKSRDSRFAFHYHDHHRACRKLAGADPAFDGSLLRWNAYGREALGLSVLLLLQLPVLFVSPITFAGLVLFGVRYHRVHKRCHVDPEWGWANVPWHMAHHVGRGDGNWCVTTGWLDRLLGTQHPWEAARQRALVDGGVR